QYVPGRERRRVDRPEVGRVRRVGGQQGAHDRNNDDHEEKGSARHRDGVLEQRKYCRRPPPQHGKRLRRARFGRRGARIEGHRVLAFGLSTVATRSVTKFTTSTMTATTITVP